MAVFAQRPKGLADLVNYAALVDDGVCLLKDGGFLAAWTYTGPDLESASHDELAVLSSQVNSSLARLGNGWMLHVDAIRRPSVGYPEAGAFPDPTTRLIDDERRERYTAEGTHFESAYYLALTYRPPAEIGNRVSALFLEGDGDRRRGWNQILDIFRKTVTSLEDALSSRLSLVRLDSSALLTYLHTCITGLRHQVRVPTIPMYLDAVIATQDLIGGFRPRIGDHHVRVIGVMGFPMESVPEVLGFLNRLPVDRWSTRFIFLDPASAERALRVYRRNWFQKRHGLLGLLKESFNFGAVTFANKDAVAMAQDADDAVAEASASVVRFGYFTCNVLLFDPDRERLDATAREVAKQLQHHGFGARVEEVNALEAYLGSLGFAGQFLDPERGRIRRAWVFVMTLSCSRHQYAELVFDQTVETWLRLHRAAFEFFGAVPRRVVLDNLRAAIVHASLHDREVQRSYRDCAEHYGFLIAPCRPRTPEHKGKVEQGGGHYVKRNALAGRAFRDIHEGNRHLLRWCVETAGRRVHGTIKRAPLEVFEALERGALQPLPLTPWELVEWKRAKLHADCHVVFAGAYYSAPTA